MHHMHQVLSLLWISSLIEQEELKQEMKKQEEPE
jgi:hypothetical protein